MNSSGRCLNAGAGIASILLILLLLIPTLAAADGMAFRYGPATSLEPLQVDEQRAVIAHKDGIQRMFIAINVQDPPSAEDPSRAAVWIFPVPGTPDRADVDVAAFIPELKGEDIKKAVDDALTAGRLVTIATQPHFLPFAFIIRYGSAAMGMPHGAPGVTTHKEIDRWGIHAEMITADSIDRLADYLRKKQVGVTEERLRPFEPYLSDKYVLVAAWISSYDDLMKEFPQHKGTQGNKRPSLYVEFPTDRPFFPMKPTSGYGTNEIGVSLYVIGWLSPDTSSWTAAENKAMARRSRYYSGDRKALESSLNRIHSQPGKEVQTTRSVDSRVQAKALDRFLEAVPEGEVAFTHTYIYCPAHNFTQDLRFLPNPRLKIVHFVTCSVWGMVPALILIVAVSSYVSGGISGLVAFRQWKPWARIGLWNCLSIAALVIAAWLRRRKLESETERTAFSERWEAFVLGVVISVPAAWCLALLVSGLRWQESWDPILLPYVQVIAELFLAAWIASKLGLTLPEKSDCSSEGRAPLVFSGMQESFVRVVLMLTPAVSLFLTLCVLGPGYRHLRLGGDWIDVPVLVSFAYLVAIVFSGMITAGLHIAICIVRNVKSVWHVPPGQSVRGKTSLPSRGKTETWILGVFTAISACNLVLSISQFDWPFSSVSLLAVVCLGLITAELILAIFVLWTGASASMSLEDRFSPAWPIGIALLLPFIALCGLIVVEVAQLSDDRSVNFLDLYPSIMAIMTILLLAVTFLARKDIAHILHEMTYRIALSAMMVVLGATAYFVLAAVFASLGGSEVKQAGTIVATVALLLGTWIIKRSLNEPPTKALRFGVSFSVVFTILSLVAYGVFSHLIDRVWG